MKFISELKSFMYPDNTVTQLMGPVIENEPKKSKKFMWILLTGLLLVGCGYLSYRYSCRYREDDD